MSNKDELQPNMLFPAILSGVHRRKDHSVRIVFETTKEIDSPSYALMDAFAMNAPEGFVNFRPNKAQAEAMPEEDAEINSKTPSQRLRNVLYRLWEDQGKPLQFFDLFYKDMMNKICEHYKSKIARH